MIRKYLICFICLVLSLTFVLGSCVGGNNSSSENSFNDNSNNDETSKNTSGENMNVNNLAYKAFYAYDYGFNIVGDDNMNVLTDGSNDVFVEMNTDINKDGKDHISLSFGDWYGKNHNVDMPKDCVAISVDLGFITDISKVGLIMKDYSKESIELFSSTDGYNFTFYHGKYDTFDGDNFFSDIDISAKSLMFVIPATVNDTIKISEIIVEGKSTHSKELLSLGATYEWGGTAHRKYPESDTLKLTDGKFFSDIGEDAICAKNSTEVDPLFKKSGSIIKLDLGEVKNVSEVNFGVFTPKSGTANIPERVNVRYSVDGNEWHDFGQSFLHTSVSSKNNASNKFLITRNHTVEARYISVYTHTTGYVMLDEISVYGSNSKVEEPEYDFINKKNQISNSNISAYKTATLNSKETNALLDMTFTKFVKGQKGQNTIEVVLEKSFDDICAIAINHKNNNVSNIEVTIGDKICSFEEYNTNVADSCVKYLFLDKNYSGNKVTVKLDSENVFEVSEIMVFAGQPQLPMVKGGFFQLPTSGGSNHSSLNSEYSWYLQLKGMKDLGMEYVVIQYGAHYNSKSTLINGKNILAKGFKYNATYGSEDVCLAVLNAAEKLGMKVYLGTMHDSDFTNPIANMESYEYIVDSAFAIIKDIDEMYGDHPAFEGYYLSDETCDQWLNLKGGVDAARYVYKNQSDLIHEIAPEAKVMIAPAIWRSGNSVLGADNLYKLIAPDNKGERPVVDIVAAQDCLGREGTLYVTDSAYKSFEEYVEEWAKAVRRAGAEFWHDAEVFEIISTSKRYEDIVDSLNIEMKTSGLVIVFDIPHYFTSYKMGVYNDPKVYYKERIMRDYIRYYNGIKHLDEIGLTADAPDVITDDGKVIDTSGTLPVVKPVVTNKKYNEGVLINKTPDISNVEKWNKFELGNSSGAVPEYSLYWDNDFLYLLLKPNDKTESYGKGVWWEGKDDLVQVWISADGSVSESVLDTNSGIRYYIHRDKGNVWRSGGSAGSLVTYSGFEFEIINDIIMVKMPWSSLNINVPVANGNTAIGIKIQYIDGADQSWASSDGSKDQSVKVKSLFSF